MKKINLPDHPIDDMKGKPETYKCIARLVANQNEIIDFIEGLRDVGDKRVSK